MLTLGFGFEPSCFHQVWSPSYIRCKFDIKEYSIFRRIDPQQSFCATSTMTDRLQECLVLVELTRRQWWSHTSEWRALSSPLLRN
ncbi:hypothetical protein J6590_101322 [Homalodisca vitripennis]|nr:hypothetical protein J6590_101322 [Homalodisca vitripennis]